MTDTSDSFSSETTSFSYHVIEYKEDPHTSANDHHQTVFPHDEYEVFIDKNKGSSSNNAQWSIKDTTVAKTPSSAAPAVSRQNLINNDEASNIRQDSGGFHDNYYYFRKTKRVLYDLFLPIDFPSSVEDSYLRYQFYDSLQGLCSYLRGVLSTGAVLKAAGVGNADATALSAAMTWAMKDGFGMLGGLVFSYYTSPLFDAYVKEFRLFADIINDIALTLDMLAPYCNIILPNNAYALLIFSSFSTLCKTMCGMAAGATKSSITIYFAKNGNMADLNAKEGTQETLVSLLGMILGIQLAKLLHQIQEQEKLVGIGDSDSEVITTGSGTAGILSWIAHDMSMTEIVTWVCFIILTFVHVWANVLGVQLLKLRSINRERIGVATNQLCQELVDDLLLKQSNHSNNKNDDKNSNNDRIQALLTKCIPSPKQLEGESLVRATYNMLFSGKLRLGVPLKQIMQKCGNTEMQEVIERLFFHNQENYVLGIETSNTKNISNTFSQVLVTLRVGADEQNDQFKAIMHALLIQKYYSKVTEKPENIAPVLSPAKVIQITYDQVNLLFNGTAGITNNSAKKANTLLGQMERKGWDVQGRLYLGFSRRRTMWKNSKTGDAIQKKLQ